MTPSARVRDYMTPTVHSIGREQKLAVAHSMMKKWRIRHLAVLDGGLIVGILSLRDLHLIETLRGVDPDEVPVEDAMTPEPYMVTPEARLRDVAGEMAKRKIGAALIARDGHAIGVLTTIDALRALVDALDELGRIAANGKDSEVRA